MNDAMWSEVRGERAVMLRTYKKDGSSVTTPVGYGLDGTGLYFMTKTSTWKVKRIARNPHVEIAASTLRGELRGPYVPGLAHEVTGTQAEHAHRLITRHNRVAWFFLLRGARRRGETWRYYVATPAGPDAADTTEPSATASTRTPDTRTPEESA